jgi:hypothetical protein
MFLFVFRSDQGTDPRELIARKALLRSEFGDTGWESPHILPRSTVSMICTSMSSARSGWLAGHGAEPRSSATRPRVSR